MSKKSKQVASRTRSWNFVVYPESAPENWRDIINELHVEWVESPLHDKDIDEETGEIKKAHWHVLILFPSVKSFEQAKEVADLINGPAPQKTMSAKGSIRYMLHLDSPHKYQYDRADLKAYGGVDLNELLKPTSSERYELIAEMMDFIDNNDVMEIKEILDYARAERFEDWFPLLCDNSAYIIGQYIKSNRHRGRRTHSNKKKKQEDEK